MQKKLTKFNSDSCKKTNKQTKNPEKTRNRRELPESHKEYLQKAHS